jgi:SNF2 family DNA or RNA helicase
MFDVLLTSYELVMKDTSYLKCFDWGVLVVDEGHRLKDRSSKLFNILATYQTRFRILLTGRLLYYRLSKNFSHSITFSHFRFLFFLLLLFLICCFSYVIGTPLQNNISELFNLLLFISPHCDIKALEKEYSSLLDGDKIKKLHEILRPHLLRRVKSDVMKQLIPSKVTIIVPVSLTRLQKQYYCAILTRNYPLLNQVYSPLYISISIPIHP